MAATATQDYWCIEILLRPNCDRVSSDGVMTGMTRKPPAAAFEFDRNDIVLAMIMSAPRFLIDF
jgi:hypothetical protein